MALDFAVTSPLLRAGLHEAACTTLASAEAYAERKLLDRHTADKCAQQGIRLVPMVVESLGGWCADAQKTWNVLATSTAASTGLHVSLATTQLYGSLSIHLQRANAKAMLSRCASSGNDCCATALATLSLIEAAHVASAAANVDPAID